MTIIHVCPETRVENTLRHTGARWAVSLVHAAEPHPSLLLIPPDRRLHLDVSDITRPVPGHVLAADDHLAALLGFLKRWDRRGALLIHCYAGVSRSPAAAFVALCLFDPATPEWAHAERIRAASPTATPNPHFVHLADRLLGRGGRMTAAIMAIGRGADCFEGAPFALPTGPSAARVDAPASLPA